MCDLAGAEVNELVAALRRRLLAGTDHADTTGEDAAAGLIAIKSVVDLLAAESNELARVIQRTGAWRADGSKSEAARLSRLLQIDHRTATDEMKIARVLPTELPVLASAFRAGAVSRAHVCAVLSVGRSNRIRAAKLPEFDEALTALAKLVTAGQMRQQMAKWSDAADPAPAIKEDQAAWDERYLRLTQFGAGVSIEGYLPVAEAMQVQAVLNSMVTKLRRANSPSHQATINEGDCERSEFLPTHSAQDQADALVAMAQQLATTGDMPRCGSVRPVVAVTVPLERIEDMNAHGVAVAAVSNGPGEAVIGHQTLQRLMCDSTIYRIVLGPSGEVLDLGREARTISKAQRRALNFRDRGCVAEGCNMQIPWCEGHHLVEWEYGGETDLGNLALLCSRHHHQLHANDYTMTRAPDGRPTIYIAMNRKKHNAAA